MYPIYIYPPTRTPPVSPVRALGLPVRAQGLPVHEQVFEYSLTATGGIRARTGTAMYVEYVRIHTESTVISMDVCIFQIPVRALG